jgi:TldD protein
VPMRRMVGVALAFAGWVSVASARSDALPAPAETVGTASDGSTAADAFFRDPDVMVLQAELRRNMARLRLPNREPPYYLAYWLLGFEEISLESQLGAIVNRDVNRGRRLRVELRVGTPELDNSHTRSMGGALFSADEGLANAPRDTHPRALERSLWLLTDGAYREALEAFDQKQTQRSSQVELELRPLDFSPAKVTGIHGQAPAELPAVDELERAIVSASKLFRQFPAVHQGSVSVDAWRIERTLVASDGSWGKEPALVVEFTIRCEGQAADGMPLVQTSVFHGVDALPELNDRVLKLGQELTELSVAEVAPDYSGPVLFLGAAAPQLVYDLVASALSGAPSEQEGAFARKLGKRVLPESFDLFDDPTQTSFEGQWLAGSYLMDDEGVPSRRVDLVEHGRLRSLLMSRAPTVELPHSNGHGRSGLGSWANGAIGNLFVATPSRLSDRDLAARLLRVVRAEGGDYGLVIERLESRGFASQGVAPPPPERVFKLYPDGRRVLVRGGEFREMNVRDLRDILAAGSRSSVHNVMVGTSGYPVPSSVVAPGLLFEQVELTKPKRSAALPKPISRPALE